MATNKNLLQDLHDKIATLVKTFVLQLQFHHWNWHSAFKTLASVFWPNFEHIFKSLKLALKDDALYIKLSCLIEVVWTL